jgi:SAM-dependent methyltransferase
MMSRQTPTFHDRFVHSRRVRVLADLFSGLIPEDASVLDVGCGDGLLASAISGRRPDVTIRGVDVLAREQTRIPVEMFDGTTIPLEDASVGAVMFADVLHHVEDPMPLLREARRVARTAVVIKDHLLEGFLAGPTLRFMDRAGNARHGVSLPYNYWPRRRWRDAFDGLGLEVETWREDLGLYPAPADRVFGRSLHFIARLGA